MRPDPDFEELVTERLRLRRSVPQDADAISAYRSLPDVRIHQGWGRTDPGAVRAELEEMQGRLPGEPGWVQFSVVEQASDEIVGDVGMSPADDEPGVIKVGYTIDPRSQGRGYATEVVRALIDYAFETLGATTVRAYADADNLASIRVMEKVGLTFQERFEGEDEDGAWTGVRYELTR
jgi:RimJ/RimL family protein N-acetyltransferase